MPDKAKFISLMHDYGDACIHYTSPVSGKEKYIVGTTDFTTKYIKEKFDQLKSRTTAKKDEGSVLIFSWDTDAFKLIDPNTVTKITPLSIMVPNDPA